MSSSRSRAGRWVIVGVAVLFIAFGGLYVVGQLGNAAKASCFEEGPFPTTVAPSEDSRTVMQTFSWWPIGRRCTWSDDTHSETLVSGDLALTLSTYIMLVLGTTAVLWCAAGASPPPR
ncbi:MAG: hypothetical protein ACTHON_17435 [Humibacter sp.]